MTFTQSPAEQSPADSDQLLETLFLDSKRELLGTLFFVVGNMEDAQDAFQDTFLKCWRSTERYGRIDNLRAWVFRIALNTGRDFRRSIWHRRRSPLAEDESMAITTDPPDVVLLWDEQLDRLRRAVLELRAEEQEVFLLRQNGELTYEQIAATTTLPLGTVKTRMRSALQQLRLVLGDAS